MGPADEGLVGYFALYDLTDGIDGFREAANNMWGLTAEGVQIALGSCIAPSNGGSGTGGGGGF
jgi:hypothetical protein